MHFKVIGYGVNFQVNQLKLANFVFQMINIIINLLVFSFCSIWYLQRYIKMFNYVCVFIYISFLFHQLLLCKCWSCVTRWIHMFWEALALSSLNTFFSLPLGGNYSVRKADLEKTMLCWHNKYSKYLKYFML